MKSYNLQQIFLQNFLKVSFAVTAFVSFIYILTPFFIPILFGGILAMAFSPFVKIIMTRGFTRVASLRILSLIMFFIGIIPTGAFFFRGARVISEMASRANSPFSAEAINHKLDGLIDKFSKIYGIPESKLNNQIDKLISKVSSFILSTFGDILSQIPDLILISIITLLSFYFFISNEERIRHLFNEYFFFQEENGNRFIKLLKSSCREVFFSNILTGTIQSIVVSFGSLIAGVGDFFLVFCTTFIFSFVPIIGAGPVAIVIAVYSLAINNIYAAIVMFVVAAVAGVSDNIIRPFLASLGTVEVPPFIGFVTVIGGVIIFGLPGLFLAPLVASVSFGLVPIMFDEYLKKENGPQ